MEKVVLYVERGKVEKVVLYVERGKVEKERGRREERCYSIIS